MCALWRIRPGPDSLLQTAMFQEELNVVQPLAVADHVVGLKGVVGRFPAKEIVLRDGTSISELQHVQDFE